MASNINYKRWRRLIIKIQLIVIIAIFIVEVVNNILLYITRSQGYGPDTIAANLMRYLVLTSIINFGLFFVSLGIVKKNPNDYKLQKYVLVISTVLILGDVSFSHYQFADTFCLFAIPICFTIFYEDKKMCLITTIVSMVPLALSCIARGMDKDYGKDIFPEAAIAFSTLIVFYIVAEFCIDNIKQTRKRLDEALIYEEEKKYADILKKKNNELEELSVEVINAFAKAVDFKDPYTAGHSRRVGEYSRKIAVRLGLSEEECKDIYFVGLLHDVGKLGIDNSIINKPGKLSDDELAEIKRHPDMGYEILKDISIKKVYAIGAKFHHERVDGKGYPSNATDIPLIGKIISVADSYDAMTSKRAYRDILPQNIVREQIEKSIGTQFDEVVAKVMLEMIDEDVDYNMKQKE